MLSPRAPRPRGRAPSFLRSSRALGPRPLPPPSLSSWKVVRLAAGGGERNPDWPPSRFLPGRLPLARGMPRNVSAPLKARGSSASPATAAEPAGFSGLLRVLPAQPPTPAEASPGAPSSPGLAATPGRCARVHTGKAFPGCRRGPTLPWRSTWCSEDPAP